MVKLQDLVNVRNVFEQKKQKALKKERNEEKSRTLKAMDLDEDAGKLINPRMYKHKTPVMDKLGIADFDNYD